MSNTFDEKCPRCPRNNSCKKNCKKCDIADAFRYLDFELHDAVTRIEELEAGIVTDPAEFGEPHTIEFDRNGFIQLCCLPDGTEIAVDKYGDDYRVITIGDDDAPDAILYITDKDECYTDEVVTPWYVADVEEEIDKLSRENLKLRLKLHRLKKRFGIENEPDDDDEENEEEFDA